MNYSELEIQVVTNTDKAVLCLLPEYEYEEVWIPFSVIEDNGEDLAKGDEEVVYVADWWMKKEGLETDND